MVSSWPSSRDSCPPPVSIVSTASWNCAGEPADSVEESRLSRLSGTLCGVHKGSS